MNKVLILGANGMLGHACSQILESSREFDLIKTSRAHLEGYTQFDANTDSIQSLIEETNPSWIINCIGIIKPHINESNPQSILNAVKINSEFPHKLATSTSARIIQIATDCVYSGLKGKYVEHDTHDAFDVYGKTKSLGEAPYENLIHLRASIIGPEMGRSTSLLEWFKNQALNAEVNGFTDHLWNGITTHHFGKIAMGIIINNYIEISKTHVIPTGDIRKADLLKEFATAYSRGDIKINEIVSSSRIDRTLDTTNNDLNLKLWQMAGYSVPPTVAEMVQEQALLVRAV